MRTISPRAVLRRAAGGFAAVGLLAAGSIALGTPAQAAGPELVIGGPAATALHPYRASGSPRKSTVGITVDNPSRNGEPGTFDGDFTVTFDLTGIAGIADAAFGESGGADCEVTGPTAVCRGHGLGPGRSALAELELSAAEGSRIGDSGTIRATGKADGVTFTAFSTEAVIGGPDLVMERLPLKQDLKPGETQPVPVAFTNNGTRAADGVLLTLMYTRGLDFVERYANCEYSEGEAGRGFPAGTTARCSVPGTYEAGATYRLAVPLSLKATEHAFHDTFVYRIDEDVPGQGAQRSAASAGAGKGAALTLKEAATVRGVDLDPRDNQQEADFVTANSADFVAYGARARGAAGETVAATIGFRNKGPAWVGHLRSGEPVATVDFTVPEGASVTGSPAACRGVTADGQYRESRSGAPRYVCDTSMAVRDGADFALRFHLKIDKVVTGASGAVTVRAPRLAESAKLPFDPKPGNNTALLVLNSDNGDGGSGSTASGGASGSGSGSGSAGPATAGGSTTGAGATSNGSTTAGAATGGSTTAGSTGGSLASTGTVALPVAAGAAVALAAGGVLYATARRRPQRG
ncbi:peptidase [Streptomyces atratus]|uniref:Peptidase n=1 Tax=Streptomyces atratus TaxID=1893 RepID=A0A2Z5JH59_STRAR|nr:peptidase [Streptomyces atratus]AXE79678.1 peptidase [Streptomyces atratus]